LVSETRHFRETELGPVVDVGEGKIYVLRSTDWNEYRKPEQFVRMMQAQNLEEWSDAMSMMAHGESNHTYADADGNIFLVWQAALPVRPHESGGDTIAIPAYDSSDIWTEIVPWEQLPHLLNPAGGYVQNSNDPFHFTNLNEVMDPADFPPFFRQPNLRLRSQHSLTLLENAGDRLTLEDVVEMKHSYLMWAAVRFKDELVDAVLSGRPSDNARAAAEVLAAWDNTVAPDSRGGVLFEEWYDRYIEPAADDSRPYRERQPELWIRPWSMDDPIGTPDGISDTDRAAAVFEEAVAEVLDRYGALDTPWGEIHRARLGDLDLPVGGCPGGLGCFRVLYFNQEDDGTRTVAGGDGWVFAVEFTDDGPRAYSVLAYGESSREESPHHTDQLEMFVNGEMKTVRFNEADIAADLVREYSPGR
jgi:acyl-homoserine-lactone acylase